MFTTLLGLVGLSPVKLIVGGLILVGVVSWMVYERHHLIAQGYANAIADIKAANEKSNEAASKGQSDVEDCYIGGGTWSRPDGVCLSPAR